MNTPEQAITLHQKAINDRDIEVYVKTVVFPFTYQNFNGSDITVNTSEEYGSLSSTVENLLERIP